jgi:hypothetical protein
VTAHPGDGPFGGASLGGGGDVAGPQGVGGQLVSGDADPGGRVDGCWGGRSLQRTCDGSRAAPRKAFLARRDDDLTNSACQRSYPRVLLFVEESRDDAAAAEVSCWVKARECSHRDESCAKHDVVACHRRKDAATKSIGQVIV